MGAHLIAVFAALTLTSSDTLPTYADSATARLVARAMERHQHEDGAVVDYLARLRYRISFSLGRRRWALIPVAAVEEQDGFVHWQAPNDLRLEIVGRRAAARSSGFNLSTIFDRPWFVPRALGDSVRIFGNEIPERAALHPLASDGPIWYHYKIVDSIRVQSSEGESLRLVAVEVTPRRDGPALIVGKMWLEQGSAEVVRLSFRYVGTQLWVAPDGTSRRDSAQARRANTWANRILSVDADLEYSLQDGKHWMPYRQVISGRVQVPLIGDFVLPFDATTTFSDYRINTGQKIAFTLPLPDSVANKDSISTARRQYRDSVRADRRERRENGREHQDSIGPRNYAGRWTGGRFEILRPGDDSLRHYTGWGDSLRLETDPDDDRRIREVQTDLANLVEKLPNQLTGRRGAGIAYERVADIMRYNRVQGLSLGFGYQVSVPWISFTTATATARYGFSDERITGRFSTVRDAPGGRWTLSGYREIRDVDPFARGQAIGNSLNAIFAGHDNADYYLGAGGSVSLEKSLSRGLELSVGGQVERASSVRREARSGINDFLGGSGLFPPNPPVSEGTLAGVTARLDGYSRRARWTLGAEVLGGKPGTTGRLYGRWRQPLGPRRAGVMLEAKAGIATVPTLSQMAFRLGGLNTVRGFDYGVLQGQAFWAVQADWALGRGRIRPVLFADAGQAGTAGGLFPGRVLSGGGIGLSILSGLIRFDVSHPIAPSSGRARFDLYFRAPR
jgi:hypothetical protein